MFCKKVGKVEDCNKEVIVMSKGTLCCSHLTKEDIDIDLIKIFIDTEKELGQNIQVNSGARCIECNASVGGKLNSAHLVLKDKKCKAFDINDQSDKMMNLYIYLYNRKVNSLERFKMLKISLELDPGMHLLIFKLLEKGVNRFGIAKSWFHFDIGKQEDGYSQNVVWMYD